MNSVDPRKAFTADDVRRHCERTGLAAPPERHEAIAATMSHIDSVVGLLRTLELGDTPPTHDPIR